MVWLVCNFACTCKQGKPKQKIQWCSWLKPRCDHFRNWRPFYPRRYRGYHRLNPALPWVMGGGNNYRLLSLIIWHSAVQQLIWKSAVQQLLRHTVPQLPETESSVCYRTHWTLNSNLRQLPQTFCCLVLLKPNQLFRNCQIVNLKNPLPILFLCCI